MLDQELTPQVAQLVHDLCAVMHQYGYDHVSVGALMRLIGVPDLQAQPHDQVLIDLVNEFGANNPTLLTTDHAPPGTLLH